MVWTWLYLGFDIGIKHWRLTLTLSFGINYRNQNRDSTLAFNIDFERWHSTLAMNIGAAFIIGNQH